MDTSIRAILTRGGVREEQRNGVPKQELATAEQDVGKPEIR